MGEVTITIMRIWGENLLICHENKCHKTVNPYGCTVKLGLIFCVQSRKYFLQFVFCNV